METFYAAEREKWQTWLAVNHLTSQEIHLVFHKKHTKKPSVPFSNAIDKAICFGWIDSSKCRLDNDRYTLRFTPRKPGSSWTAQNVERTERLIEQGLMSPNSLKIFERGARRMA